MHRQGKFAAAALIIVASLSLAKAGDDSLSRVAFVDSVATSRGTGVMRVILSEAIPNPADCSGSSSGREAAIQLEIAADITLQANDRNMANGRPVDSGPTQAESLEREEIRLMTDNVFLAAISSYEIQVLIDGTSCAGDNSLPMVKSVLVSP